MAKSSGVFLVAASTAFLLLDNARAFSPRARNPAVSVRQQRPLSYYSSPDQFYYWDQPAGYSTTYYEPPPPPYYHGWGGPLWGNPYDTWTSDGLVRETFPLTEESVVECLEIMKDSDYGQQMFGRNDQASSIGVTGDIKLVEVEGPFVVLSLEGEFWHRRATVLGKAAIWLNACIPEIVEVNVADALELEDFEDFIDEDTGELLYVHDKRSPDFNGDRGTMEYQGIDPDVRGPFPKQGFTINPM